MAVFLPLFAAAIVGVNSEIVPPLVSFVLATTSARDHVESSFPSVRAFGDLENGVERDAFEKNATERLLLNGQLPGCFNNHGEHSSCWVNHDLVHLVRRISLQAFT